MHQAAQVAVGTVRRVRMCQAAQVPPAVLVRQVSTARRVMNRPRQVVHAIRVALMVAISRTIHSLPSPSGIMTVRFKWM